MENKTDLIKYFNEYCETLTEKRGINQDQVVRLRRRGFFFDRLIPEKGGIVGYIVPALITIVFFVVGYIVGIFDAEVSLDAQIEYSFWVTFIAIATYLLDWLVDAISRVVQEADRQMNIKYITHKKILNFMFGFKGVLISCLIALPFILYDITGFGNPDEGWINDILWYKQYSDDSWYPNISATSNGVGVGSLLWLAVWSILWFYFGAFVWLAFAFLFYINTTLKSAKFREDIQTIVREKQYKHLLHLSIMCYLPFVPFLAMKIWFQIFCEAWASDIIGTYLLFGLFMMGVIFGPVLISREITLRKNQAITSISEVVNRRYEMVGKALLAGKDVDALDAIKANLAIMYSKDLIESLSQKVLDKKLVKRMIMAVCTPVISYIIKFLLTQGIF